MRKIIKQLISLVDEGRVSPRFDVANEQFVHEWLHIFRHDILSWLKSDLFVPRKKAVRYPNSPQWFVNYSLFIQGTDELNELFHCENYSLDFREEISFEERMKIHEYVDENYKPYLFTTQR